MISIIVTAYNQPTSIQWLLAALREQEGGISCEVLVCDDGSTPEVFDVVHAACRRVPFDLRYVWQPDEDFRAGRSRNNGIRLAQGDLLLFLDGDVIVEADFLARHAAAHTRSPRLVAGLVKRVPERRAPSSSPWTRAADGLAFARAYAGADAFPEQQDDWADGPQAWMTCVGANFSCPRRPEVTFDERFIGWGAEDRELAYRLTHQHGYEPVYERSAVVYHLGEGSVASVAKDSDRLVRLLRNMVYFRSLYPGADLSPTLDLARHCHFNRIAGRWVATHLPRNRPASAVLDEAEAWLRERGLLSAR